jgi:hypothetical protein
MNDNGLRGALAACVHRLSWLYDVQDSEPIGSAAWMAAGSEIPNVIRRIQFWWGVKCP